MIVWLNVPYKEHQEARSAGARWSQEAGRWYVSSNRDLWPFTRWIPVCSAQKVVERERVLAKKIATPCKRTRKAPGLIGTPGYRPWENRST